MCFYDKSCCAAYLCANKCDYAHYFRLPDHLWDREIYYHLLDVGTGKRKKKESKRSAIKGRFTAEVGQWGNNISSRIRQHQRFEIWVTVRKALDTQTGGIGAIRKTVKPSRKPWVKWFSGFECKWLAFSFHGPCSRSICSCWAHSHLWHYCSFSRNKRQRLKNFRTLCMCFHWRAFLPQV